MTDLFGEKPHSERHPITGVEMNIIVKKRRKLTFIEAVTVWVMKLQGVSYTDIVHKLGANANRIGEVIRGDAHPNALPEAYRLLTE